MRTLATLTPISSTSQGLLRPHVSPSGGGSAAIEPTAGPVRDESFLIAFLPHVLALAARHVEPVSVLCVATDRLGAIRELHGPGLAGAAVRLVAETVVKTLRASDVVARLDDGRIVAVLPFAGAPDLPMIAEAVRKAIIEAGAPTGSMPLLTASIGMAAYPDHAGDASSLLSAAASALDRALLLGPNQAAEAGAVA